MHFQHRLRTSVLLLIKHQLYPLKRGSVVPNAETLPYPCRESNPSLLASYIADCCPVRVRHMATATFIGPLLSWNTYLRYRGLEAYCWTMTYPESVQILTAHFPKVHFRIMLLSRCVSHV